MLRSPLACYHFPSLCAIGGSVEFFSPLRSASFSGNAGRVNYMVRGLDGKEYGPVDETTLRSWAQENRIQPQSELRDTLTGRMVMASSVPGLFAAPTVPQTIPPGGAVPPVPGIPGAPGQPWQNPPSPYPRAGMPTMTPVKRGGISGSNAILGGIIFRCALALVLFFVLHGIGVIVAGYALFYAFQARQEDHEHGNLALAIAVVTMLVILGGWFLRFQSSGRI